MFVFHVSDELVEASQRGTPDGHAQLNFPAVSETEPEQGFETLLYRRSCPCESERVFKCPLVRTISSRLGRSKATSSQTCPP
jgi:hypothetical protein